MEISNHQYSDVEQGLDLMWNNKFDQADEHFKKQKLSNPRYSLHFAEVNPLLV